MPVRYYLYPAKLIVVLEMNRPVNPRTKRSDIRRQLAGWGGLFLYALVLSPVGMVMLGIFGTLDPDHRARLEFGAEGVQLVLRHDGACVGHQHQAVARVLTLFAAERSAANPDHVLQFRSATSLARDAQAVVSAPKQSELSIFDFAVPVAFVSAGDTEFIPPPRPPPDLVVNHLNVRSTVYLI